MKGDFDFDIPVLTDICKNEMDGNNVKIDFTIIGVSS
jgi:hypothetical protein